MATRVVSPGITTRVSTISAGNTTSVTKVVIGTPVRRVSDAGSNINTLNGVNASSRVTGSVLVYNASTTNWEATLLLENQNINGGSY